MPEPELMEQCRWPDLPPPYGAALRQAVTWALARFDAVGIIAAGTIVRGSPDRASDLDLFVIHHAPVRQRIQRFFHGVPAEIFVNPPASVRQYFAAEQERGRPSAAHMVATGHVVLERDPVIRQLRAEAEKRLRTPSPLSAEDAVQGRYMAATLLEDALDVAERDPATAGLLLAQAVTAMLHFHFRAAGLFIPRAKDLLRVLSELDPELGAEAVRFFTAAAFAERLAAAEAVADRTIGTRGFFEWESPPEELSG